MWDRCRDGLPCRVSEGLGDCVNASGVAAAARAFGYPVGKHATAAIGRHVTWGSVHRSADVAEACLLLASEATGNASFAFSGPALHQGDVVQNLLNAGRGRSTAVLPTHIDGHVAVKHGR